NLRNRLPLSTLTVVVADPQALAGFESIVADEVNVKSVRLVAADSDEAAAYGVEQKLTVNARAAGPRLGKDVQLAIKGSKSGDWSVADDGSVTSGGLALVEGEFTLETVAGSADADSATGVLPGGGFVVLDTAVTPELAAEGLARDLVRAVQQARRDAGLDVSTGSPSLSAARTPSRLRLEPMRPSLPPRRSQRRTKWSLETPQRMTCRSATARGPRSRWCAPDAGHLAGAVPRRCRGERLSTHWRVLGGRHRWALPGV
ncbi:MAG: DUF5915 domain-containing protein, partial [Nocardioides sp.]